MGSHEIFSTQKKKGHWQGSILFHRGQNTPQAKDDIHAGRCPTSCNVKWYADEPQQQEVAQIKQATKKWEKRERNTRAEDELSRQARCCKVAKVSEPRWSPCSHSQEQRIHIRGHVYLRGKQQLSAVSRRSGAKTRRIKVSGSHLQSWKFGNRRRRHSSKTFILEVRCGTNVSSQEAGRLIWRGG